ncbi:MAG: DNA polymerase III subunit alpha, partial [Candidatus Neomarinimicrobiota bacterium]
LKARSVVRDVARVLGVSFAEADRIAKLIPESPKITIEKAFEENPDLAQAESVDQVHGELFRFSRVLEGMNRHASTHAAGVVIAPGDLVDYVPLYKHPKTGDITTQVDMVGLEDLGLLKMDFLGLRTLTVIDRAVKMLANRGIQLDMDKVPLDDQATYQLFSQGQTTGIFQFESSGMREFLTKLQPTCIEDLIAMNALYRPGPMAFIDDFIDRKHGRKKITYLHVALEPLLKETYGIIVYQEQVMQIAHAIAGFSLADADLMRRAMGKKKKKEMEQLKGDFIAGAKINNLPENSAQEIYDLIARFAEYGFNKSHSTAYAFVAYQTAYLKAHHPAEFMAANLSSEMSNIDRMQVLLSETREMGLEVLPPDINLSGRNFRVDDQGRIIFGLNAIKHVGQKAADHIHDIREDKDSWRILPEFLTDLDLRLVNRKAVESLIKSGSADSLEGSRAQKFTLLEDALKYAQGLQAGAASNQESLFGKSSQGVMADPPPLPDTPPWTDQQHFDMEKELTGYYLSGHPLQAFTVDLKEFSNHDFSDPQASLKLDQLRLGGIISQLKNHHTKKGLPMAFLTLEAMAGQVEVVVFSDLYPKVRHLLAKETKVFVVGKPTTGGLPGGDRGQAENGTRAVVEIKVLAEDIVPLEEVRRHLAHKVNVRLTMSRLKPELIHELHSIANRNRGSCELWLFVAEDGGNGAEPYTRRIKSTNLRITPAPDFLAELRGLVGEQNVWLTNK